MEIVLYGYSSFLAFTFPSIKGRNSPSQEENAQTQTHILSAMLFLSHADRRVFQTVCDQINKTAHFVIYESDVAGHS